MMAIVAQFGMGYSQIYLYYEKYLENSLEQIWRQCNNNFLWVIPKFTYIMRNI